MRPAGSAENDTAQVAIAVPPRFGDAHHPKQSKRESEKEKSSCCRHAARGTGRRRSKDGLGSKAVAFFARGGGRSGIEELRYRGGTIRDFSQWSTTERKSAAEQCRKQRGWRRVGTLWRTMCSGRNAAGLGGGGDFGRCDGRHSGLVRCFDRVFGNEGTVERDRGADPARNGPRGGGFRAGSRVGTVAGPAGDRQSRRSRRDGPEPPRLDIEGDQQRL